VSILSKHRQQSEMHLCKLGRFTKQVIRSLDCASHRTNVHMLYVWKLFDELPLCHTLFDALRGKSCVNMSYVCCQLMYWIFSLLLILNLQQLFDCDVVSRLSMSDQDELGLL
jgi:hypothetical protein